MKDFLVSILMIESNAPFVRVIEAETRDDARAAALASWQVMCINNVTWQPFRTIAKIEVLERPGPAVEFAPEDVPDFDGSISNPDRPVKVVPHNAGWGQW